MKKYKILKIFNKDMDNKVWEILKLDDNRKTLVN